MTGSGTCQHCGCSEIDRDPQRGDAVCTNCGSVLEDNIIVSEVQFEETGHGGSRAIGQLVSAEGQASGGLNLGYQHGMGRESRVMTLDKARRRILQIASHLKLNPHCINTANNFYKMALSRRLTRGRRNTHVIAACIYMVCRIEATDHMLLDLSDVVQVNVYELGRTYLHLSSALCINIPALDPSLYIRRFAHRLEFGDRTHDVEMTALRMVQRMKRDWMHIGRRPSGLCGAALLVAARLHNFNRTVKDVIKVVKVCEATVKKRLTEFGDTPSSRLTKEEFMSIDLEEEQDPPSFKSARKKKLQQLEDPSRTEDVQEVSQLQIKIEKMLSDRKKKLKGTTTTYSQFTPQEEMAVAEQFVVEETIETINDYVSSTCESLNNILLPEESTAREIQRGPGPTAASLGLKQSIEECMRIDASAEEPEADGELDLTGIDDKELEGYIMTSEEVKVKTHLWMSVHAEFLEQQREKQLLKEKEEEENAKKTDQPKKRKRPTKKKSGAQANTAGEAIEKMLQEKKLSSKINYDVLKNLDTSSTAAASIVVEETQHQPLGPPTPRTPKAASLQSLGAPPRSISGLMSTILRNHKKRSVLPKTEASAGEPADRDARADDNERLEDLEAANMEPHEDADLEQEMDVADEEADEDDNYLSAAQLLGQHRGEEEGEFYEEDEDDYDDYR